MGRLSIECWGSEGAMVRKTGRIKEFIKEFQEQVDNSTKVLGKSSSNQI